MTLYPLQGHHYTFAFVNIYCTSSGTLLNPLIASILFFWIHSLTLSINANLNLPKQKVSLSLSFRNLLSISFFPFTSQFHKMIALLFSLLRTQLLFTLVQDWLPPYWDYLEVTQGVLLPILGPHSICLTFSSDWPSPFRYMSSSSSFRTTLSPDHSILWAFPPLTFLF